MAVAQAAASRAGSPWLVMTGSNVAFDPVGAKWYAISVKKVFGFYLGTWKYNSQECGFKPGPAERRLQRKAEAEERQRKYQAQQAQRKEYGEAEAEEEEEEEDEDEAEDEDEDEEDEKESWDYESSEDEEEDYEWGTLMDLTWAQDGPFFCCMDCSHDEEGYDTDDPAPRGRVLVFNALDGSCKRIPDFDQLSLPAGVGVQAKPDGNYRTVVVTAEVEANDVSISVWDSNSGSISSKDGGSCSFKEAAEYYSSNFILDGCFYFLLEYTGGFSALYFDLASNRWSYWATGLKQDFFLKVSVNPNLLKSQDRLLALGGLPGQGLVIVELTKPQREATLNRYSHPSYLHRSFVPAPAKDRPHRAGTFKVVARMPRTMWKEFRKSSESGVRAFANDEFVYALPDRKLKADDKVVVYVSSSATWQWTAPFPDKCEEGGELHWNQMLGGSSVVVNHPKYGNVDAGTSYHDYDDNRHNFIDCW